MAAVVGRGSASIASRAGMAVCALAVTVALGACTAGAHAPSTAAAAGRSGSASASASASASSPPSPRPSTATTAPALAHVVVILEENKPSTSVVGNPDAPYLNSLAQSGARATRYSAVAHPSLPNYLALTSGTTAGITSDCNPPGGDCLDTGPNLAQSLDSSGRSWKMYAESMPAPCSTGNTSVYAVKHNPFLYFPSVTSDAAYCRTHDVPYDQLSADLAGQHTLPAFSFISPNLCDDMHDCSVATGDSWLRANVPRILASPAFTAQRSLLVVTFDEGDSADNVVDCVFAGPAARPGAVVSTPFTHYSLLRTIEQAWGLPPLTANDAGATPMTQLLR